MGRRLGQHFLTDPAILDRIVSAIDPQPTDIVLEIGPGPGSLTERLATRVGRVVAIEKDPVLAEKQMSNVQHPISNVEMVIGDALTHDWSALLSSIFGVGHSTFAFKVIGNIPYYITSPLIEKALTPPLPAVIVFLVQKEFADRLVAAPGSKTYGGLSAGVQTIANVERLFTVRAGAFRPPPKVDSAVVRLVPRPDPLVTLGEHPAFRTFLAAVFSQRRKQLVRSLRDVFKADKTAVEVMLEKLAIAPDARAEVITPAQLVGIFRYGRSLANEVVEN